MILKKATKTKSAKPNRERTERVRRKAESAGTNEDNVAAELKNRAHGSEQPAR